MLRSHGPLATKQISRAEDGSWCIEPYGRAAHFAVSEIKVDGLASLGCALEAIACNPRAFVIRGQPLSGIDRARSRRLVYETITDDGGVHAATFKPAARRWLGIDFDDLSTPTWNAGALAARREAIRRDRERQPRPWGGWAHPDDTPAWSEDEIERQVRAAAASPWPPPLEAVPRQPGEPLPIWSEAAGAQAGAHGEDPDADPGPIDPARDWGLVVEAAIATLPREFAGRSCWWQMTSSAGIKPGVRLRLWFWLARAVSDAEAKRWLADAPVDLALYSPVQAHYTAPPIFDPPELDHAAHA